MGTIKDKNEETQQARLKRSRRDVKTHMEELCKKDLNGTD